MSDNRRVASVNYAAGSHQPYQARFNTTSAESVESPGKPLSFSTFSSSYKRPDSFASSSYSSPSITDQGQSPHSTAATSSPDYTQRGLQWSFKDTLLARYQTLMTNKTMPHVQFLIPEDKLVNDRVLAVDRKSSSVVKQPALSLVQPLTAIELKAKQSKAFHFQYQYPTKAPRQHQTRFTDEQQGAVANNGVSYQQPRQYQSRRGGYGGNQIQSRGGYQPQQQQSRQLSQSVEDEAPILWGDVPVPVGSGNFDAKGQFVTESMTPVQQQSIIQPLSKQSVISSKAPGVGSGAGSPPATTTAVPTPPGFGFTLPSITTMTAWVYRDPTGTVQGPFLNARMLEWYQAGYFPDSLPLKRDSDPFFDTLGGWKIKCGGRVPFELDTSIKTAKSNALPTTPTAASVSELSSTKVPIQQHTAQLAQSSKPAVSPAVTESAIKKAPMASDSIIDSLMTGKLEQMSLNTSPVREEGLSCKHQVPVSAKVSFAAHLTTPASSSSSASPARSFKSAAKQNSEEGTSTAGSKTVELKPERGVIKTASNKTATPALAGESKDHRIVETKMLINWIASCLPEQSPIDAPTLYGLLSSLPCTMNDVITFCQDNSVSLSVSVRSFAQEWVSKCKGSEVAKKQAALLAKQPSLIDDRDIKGKVHDALDDWKQVKKQ